MRFEIIAFEWEDNVQLVNILFQLPVPSDP